MIRGRRQVPKRQGWRLVFEQSSALLAQPQQETHHLACCGEQLAGHEAKRRPMKEQTTVLIEPGPVRISEERVWKLQVPGWGQVQLHVGWGQAPVRVVSPHPDLICLPHHSYQ